MQKCHNPITFSHIIWKKHVFLLFSCYQLIFITTFPGTLGISDGEKDNMNHRIIRKLFDVFLIWSYVLSWIMKIYFFLFQFKKDFRFFRFISFTFAWNVRPWHCLTFMDNLLFCKKHWIPITQPRTNMLCARNKLISNVGGYFYQP